MGYLVTRQDGSTAYVEEEDQAKMYAQDVGGTVEEYSPVSADVNSVDNAPDGGSSDSDPDATGTE